MTPAARGTTAVDGGDSLPPDALEPDPKYRGVLEWVWSFSARSRTPEEMSTQRATKLDRMYALLAALEHPEWAFPSLLVAGTKGKGSTVAMLAACLQAQGLRTGRYTSPHLVNWRERTCVDAQPISEESVLALAEPIRTAVLNLARALGHVWRGPRFCFSLFRPWITNRRGGGRAWRRWSIGRTQPIRAAGFGDPL